MIKILDFIINALALWRSKIAIKNQVADLSQLDGKADAQTAGFHPVKRFDWLSDVEALKRIEDDVLADIADNEQQPKAGILHPGQFFASMTDFKNGKAMSEEQVEALHKRIKPLPVYFPGVTEQDVEGMVNKLQGKAHQDVRDAIMFGYHGMSNTENKVAHTSEVIGYDSEGRVVWIGKNGARERGYVGGWHAPIEKRESRFDELPQLTFGNRVSQKLAKEEILKALFEKLKRDNEVFVQEQYRFTFVEKIGVSPFDAPCYNLFFDGVLLGEVDAYPSGSYSAVTFTPYPSTSQPDANPA